MESYFEDHQALSQSHTYSSSPPSGVTPSTPGKRPTSIRPLTAAYQASASQHQVRFSLGLEIKNGYQC